MKFSLDVCPSASWGSVLFVFSSTKMKKWIIGFDWYFWTKTRRRCKSKMWLTLASTNSEEPDFVVSGMKTNKHEKLCPFWWKRKTNPSSHELAKQITRSPNCPQAQILDSIQIIPRQCYSLRNKEIQSIQFIVNKLILINNNFTKNVISQNTFTKR